MSSSTPGATADRLDYLRETAALLWPGANVEVARARAGGDFLLLPNATRPRLLVPADNRRAAASAVRGYGESAARSDRARARLLALGLRSGIARPLLGDRVKITAAADSLPAHLGEVLGAEVRVSLYLSAPRANRKPVLQLLDTRGRRLGYVKVGVDKLTGRLVRAETAALHRLADIGPAGLLTPAVIHAGQWHDLPILVQAALPIDGPRAQLRPAALTAAMAAVAQIDRAEATPLAATPFWSELCARIGGLPDGPSAVGLGRILNGLYDVAGGQELETGSWHGDWTPWNMAAVRTGLAVWDWERFAAGRPIGFDVLHFVLQRELVTDHREPASAVARCLDDAARALAPLGVDAERAITTALLYLTEIATRYTEDGQADAGARLGRVQDWLLPALLARLERCPR